MGSALGGWLALGAFIALVGNLIRHGRRDAGSLRAARIQNRAGGWLMVIGAMVIAWGFVPMLSTVHIGSGTPTAVTAPEPAPEVTTPPVTEAPEVVSTTTAERTAFWEDLSSSAKFFLVFLGIFAFGCLVGISSQTSDLTTQIVGGFIGFIIAAIGVGGMLFSCGAWLLK